MAGNGRRRSGANGAGPAGRGAKHVVVVESPAKARTIGRYLGPSYRVIATRGHVRDLPAKAGSVKPEDGFAMVTETGKRAARTLAAVAKALAKAECQSALKLAQLAKRRHGLAIAALRHALGDGWSPSSMRWNHLR